MGYSKQKDNILSGVNATAVLIMLVEEGLPLKDAKDLVWSLWQKGDLPFRTIEQYRRWSQDNYNGRWSQ